MRCGRDVLMMDSKYYPFIDGISVQRDERQCDATDTSFGRRNSLRETEEDARAADYTIAIAIERIVRIIDGWSIIYFSCLVLFFSTTTSEKKKREPSFTRTSFIATLITCD